MTQAGENGAPPTRLARKLGLGDAILVGLGSMIGAGVFSAVGPAARIGFSSFAVLVYYAVTNASALTLPRDVRGRSRPVAALGLIGCIAVATSLPATAVEGGAIVLAAGAAVYAVRRFTSSA